MAWKNPGLVAIHQNYMHTSEVAIDPVSSNAQQGYEHINVMNYTPSRPMKFDSATATEKRIRFIFLRAYQISSIAIIDPHSNTGLAQAGDVEVEDQLQFKLQYASGIIFDWTQLSAGMMDDWGTSFYRSFSAVSISAGSWLELNVKRSNGSLGAASIGPILVGRSYTFPSNPLITYNRSVQSSTIFTGRQGGAATIALRDPAQRTLNIRVRATDEDDRVEIERYIAGRGRMRAGGGTGNELARRRMDIPTALVSPEMWFDSSATYGGCIFGRFVGGLVTQSYIGGAAMCDLQFQEMV